MRRRDVSTERTEFDLSPTGLTKILAEYGVAIENLQEYEKIQNGSLVKMAQKIESLNDKFDKKFDELKTDMFKGFDEIKTLVYEKNTTASKDSSARSKQIITWFIAVAIGAPGFFWGLIQVIRALTQ